MLTLSHGGGYGGGVCVESRCRVCGLERVRLLAEESAMTYGAS